MFNISMKELNTNLDKKSKDKQQLKNKDFIADFFKYNCLWETSLQNETREYKNILLYNLDCFFFIYIK